MAVQLSQKVDCPLGERNYVRLAHLHALGRNAPLCTLQRRTRPTPPCSRIIWATCSLKAASKALRIRFMSSKTLVGEDPIEVSTRIRPTTPLAPSSWSKRLIGKGVIAQTTKLAVVGRKDGVAHGHLLFGKLRYQSLDAWAAATAACWCTRTVAVLFRALCTTLFGCQMKQMSAATNSPGNKLIRRPLNSSGSKI